MTRTVEQAKLVLAKAKANPDIKVQVGVQGMSDDSYITANKYVQDGALGQVVMAQIDYSRNGKEDLWEYEYDPDVKPGVNLDWKTWLGDAPKHEFEPDRFHRWRKYWDYSGGISGDLFVHRVTRIIKSLGSDFSGIRHGRGRTICVQDTRRSARYDGRSARLSRGRDRTTGQLNGERSQDRSSAARAQSDARVQLDGFTIVPQKLFQGEVKEVVHTKSGAEDVLLHHRNLHNAIRKNEPLNCPVELGYYGVVASEMGVLSLRRRALHEVG